VADRVQVAFIFGLVAKGAEKASSDIDLLVIGDVGCGEVASSLNMVEGKLGEINPTGYPLSEYSAKLKKKKHFLTTVLRQKRIFVMGDDHELRRLG
jgi:uncharacterized protein